MARRYSTRAKACGPPPPLLRPSSCFLAPQPLLLLVLLVLVAVAVLLYRCAFLLLAPSRGKSLIPQFDGVRLDVQKKFNTNHGHKWQATVTGEAKTLQEWTIDGREGPSCVRPPTPLRIL